MAFEDSMELVRDFQTYSNEIDDEKIREVFKEYAEDEGLHASELLDILKGFDTK